MAYNLHNYVGTSAELHKPTKDTINPAYYYTNNDDYKKSVVESDSYNYEEVNIPPEVKMTKNPAYAMS